MEKFLCIDQLLDITNPSSESMTSFRLQNGTFRTSASRRLDDVNQIALEYLPSAESLQILDLAISSGITSVEWKAQLDSNDRKNTFTGVDSTVFVSRIKKHGLTLLLQEYGECKKQHLLQIDINDHPFPNASGSRWRNAVCRIASLITRCMQLKGEKVMFVAPEVRKTVSADASFRVEEMDIFNLDSKINGQSFNVIRAANILNVAYFPADRILQVVHSLHRVMMPDGVFIVVRTHSDGSNHGAIYSRRDAGFKHVRDIGQGSEIHPIVEQFNRMSQASTTE